MAEGQKHTDGLLRLPNNDDDFVGACVLRGDGFLVADCNVFGPEGTSPTEAECSANARRVAAAWNACAGIPTEELEAGLPNTHAESGLVKELVEALELLWGQAMDANGVMAEYVAMP